MHIFSYGDTRPHETQQDKGFVFFLLCLFPKTYEKNNNLEGHYAGLKSRSSCRGAPITPSRTVSALFRAACVYIPPHMFTHTHTKSFLFTCLLVKGQARTSTLQQPHTLNPTAYALNRKHRAQALGAGSRCSGSTRALASLY